MNCIYRVCDYPASLRLAKILSWIIVCWGKLCQQFSFVVINNYRKGFWRAKLPHFHTKPYTADWKKVLNKKYKLYKNNTTKWFSVNCVNIGTVNQEIFLKCHEENVSVLFIFMICTIFEQCSLHHSNKRGHREMLYSWKVMKSDQRVSSLYFRPEKVRTFFIFCQTGSS